MTWCFEECLGTLCWKYTDYPEISAKMDNLEKLSTVLKRARQKLALVPRQDMQGPSAGPLRLCPHLPPAHHPETYPGAAELRKVIGFMSPTAQKS